MSLRGATEPLDDVFKRLGVGAIEEYAEFVPEGLEARGRQEPLCR